MIFKKTFYIFAILTLLVYSCEYEPKENFQRKVNLDVPAPEVTIVKMPLNGDTVYLYWDYFMPGNSVSLDFKFSGKPQGIRNVKFRINSTEIESLPDGDSVYRPQFSFDILNEGINKLSAEIYTESGTASIADKMGMEGFKVTKSWILIVDRSHRTEIKASVINGYLNLTWPACPFSGFKGYSVSKMENNITKYLGFVASPSFTDSSYVGEISPFFWTSIVKDNLPFNYSTQAYNPPNDLPKMHAITIGGKKFVTWNKSKYYNAVETYTLYDGNIGDGRILKVTNNPNDTTFEITQPLTGITPWVYLLLKPKKINPEYYKTNIYYYTSLLVLY